MAKSKKLETTDPGTEQPLEKQLPGPAAPTDMVNGDDDRGGGIGGDRGGGDEIDDILPPRPPLARQLSDKVTAVVVAAPGAAVNVAVGAPWVVLATAKQFVCDLLGFNVFKQVGDTAAICKSNGKQLAWLLAPLLVVVALQHCKPVNETFHHYCSQHELVPYDQFLSSASKACARGVTLTLPSYLSYGPLRAWQWSSEPYHPDDLIVAQLMTLSHNGHRYVGFLGEWRRLPLPLRPLGPALSFFADWARCLGALLGFWAMHKTYSKFALWVTWGFKTILLEIVAPGVVLLLVLEHFADANRPAALMAMATGYLGYYQLTFKDYTLASYAFVNPFHNPKTKKVDTTRVASLAAVVAAIAYLRPSTFGCF